MLPGMKNWLKAHPHRIYRICAFVFWLAACLAMPQADSARGWISVVLFAVAASLYNAHDSLSERAKIDKAIAAIRQDRAYWLSIMQDDVARDANKSALIAWRSADNFTTALRRLGISETMPAAPPDTPQPIACPYCTQPIETFTDHEGWCDLVRSLIHSPPTSWPALRHGYTITEALAAALTRGKVRA